MKDKRLSDSTKLGYHRDVIDAHFEHGQRVAPIHLDVGVAKFCNIRCSFCFGMFQEPQKIYIPRPALFSLIEDAGKIGVKSMAFIGDGEPTVNIHVYDALRYAKELGKLDMAISTNGVLLTTDDRRDALLSSCTWMRYCISAGTKEGYEKVHGFDHLEKVTRNIEATVALKAKMGYKCDLGMQAVFVPTTMKEEMIEEAKLAVALGVDYFVIKQCSVPDFGESGMDRFDLNEYDAEATKEALLKCESLSTDKTKIIVKWQAMERKGTRNYAGCPSVPFISEISGNGNWFPCGYWFADKPEFEKYKFGNVIESRLIDIFNSDRYDHILKMMRSNFNSLTDCRGACRLDATNEFCYNYLYGGIDNWPTNHSEVMGINFV